MWACNAGLREAKAAFQALPQITRDALNGATEVTVREIARHARAKVQASPSIRTRTLYNALGWTMNKKNGRGRAGVTNVTTTVRVDGEKRKVKGKIIGTKVVRPSRYAHLVEFGARHMNAEPLMMPATESQKSAYLSRCQKAGRDIEKNAAAIGMRNL